MTKFTKTIREKFESKADSVTSLAKALKISEPFARVVIGCDKAPLSPRVVMELSKRYRLPLKDLVIMAEKRNKIGRAYQKKYRSKSSS